MTKKDIRYMKLFIQENVNTALEQYQTQQRKLIEVVARKEEKKKEE